MDTKLHAPSAGLVEYPNGATGVLVAGGRMYLNSSFLNLETLQWEQKKSLPHDICDGQSIPYGKSFLIAGGGTYNPIHYYLDTIYYYNPEKDDWELQGTMNDEQVLSPIFLVPDWYAKCSDVVA